MKSLKHQKGVAEWVVVIATIAVVAVIGLIIAATSDENTPPPPSQVPGTKDICYTSCLGLVELQCGDNKLMGACFGLWDCSAGHGAHKCK